MSDREIFYDDVITPGLIDLARKCEDNGLSFVAHVEFDPGEMGRTVTMQKGAGVAIKLTELAARCGGNVDSLIMAIMKHAGEHGHSSICLKKLGVPLTPETKETT